MAATLDVADTDDNAAAFGKLSGLRGPGGFPQVRFVSLVESGTHVLLASETSMIRTCQGKTEISLHSEEFPEAP